LPPNRLFRTESFHLAAVFALLFLGFAAVFMTSVYWIVTSAQRSALLDAIDADIGTISNGYRSEGIPEAIEVIEQRLGPTVRPDRIHQDEFIILQDAAGRRLAGNLPPLPRRLGLLEIGATQSGARPEDSLDDYPRLLGKGIVLGEGAYLFIGRSTRAMGAVQAHLLQAFAWITIAAVAMALLGGALSSLRYMRRIDGITRTCNAIMAGHFAERIALRGSGDELDRLGAAINRMLDRIGTLMENLRQVSSDIAHDLRTPLTRLRHRLEQAQHSHTIETYAQEIARAIKETDQALAIFAALLRIAQIEANSQPRGFLEYSLSDQLGKLAELYRPVAEDAGHTLTAAISNDIRVRGDQELLMQLFANLLENSIRHTPRGVGIGLTLERISNFAQVTVSDQGPGIPESEREKVLRRFYRLSASRSTPGTGLGLALASAIARLHDAQLVLGDNEPGLRVELKLQAA